MLKTKSKDSSLCPICKSTSGTTLQIFDCKSASNHIYSNDGNKNSDFLTKHVEKLWGAGTCYFILCDNCSLAYASPFIGGDSIFYQTIYNNPISYSKWKWEFKATFDRILQVVNERPIPCPVNLLEIGAGNGSFVKQIQKANIDPDNILTTEFSSYGKLQIEKLGIKCINSELSNICSLEYKNKFDFICMFQVLEHMQDLDEVFLSLSFLLKQQGHIFIAVPNNYHREYFESIGIIEDVPPIHITRWNKKCFNFVAKKYGFTIIGHKIEPNKIYKNISKYLNFKYKNKIIIRKINNLQNRLIRALLKLIIFTPLLIINLKYLKLMKNSNLGISQWVELQKT